MAGRNAMVQSEKGLLLWVPFASMARRNAMVVPEEGHLVT